MTTLKVLVVDDAAFIRDLVRRTLRARLPGLVTEEAVNGRKAQQLLSRDSYQLVLCDWEMPEMSGIELLRWVRQELDAKLPFVMVTSRGDKDNVVEAIQAGVTDYMGKPFSSDSLVKKVVKVLGRHHDLAILEGRQTRTSGGIAQGSVDALTGGRQSATTRAKASPRPSGDAAAAPGTSTATPGRPQPAAAKAAVSKSATASQKGSPQAGKAAERSQQASCQLRFGDQSSQCLIKNLSLKQVSLAGRAQDGIPALLESVVLDLQQEDNAEVARINAYVWQLQATDTSTESGLYNLILRIVDQDPDKLTFLSRMIARGTTSGQYIPGA